MITAQPRTPIRPIQSNELTRLPRPNAMLNVIEFVCSGMMSHQQAYNEMLLMPAIESPMISIEDHIDLHHEIVLPAITTTEASLKDKPIRFFKEIDPALPSIKGDKHRISQVLLNLLSNAVQYTEEGSITLRVTHLRREILFSVIDTGYGIRAEHQLHIFEPYMQAETGVRHSLGLPACKRLIEAHQGRFWVKSEYGHGAAFYFTLPL